jgi:hypothetical protein
LNDRPTSVELLRAVGRFLEAEVVPVLEGPRRYHARVAAHLVASVAREIETEEAHLLAEWEGLGALLGDPAPAPRDRERLREGVHQRNAALVERIRAGDADAAPWRGAVLRHLRATVDAKLEVARPAREQPAPAGRG